MGIEQSYIKRLIEIEKRQNEMSIIIDLEMWKSLLKVSTVTNIAILSLIVFAYQLFGMFDWLCIVLSTFHIIWTGFIIYMIISKKNELSKHKTNNHE